MTQKRAVVLMSGGVDSSLVAALARAEGYTILALTIDYNQRHRIELERAAHVATALGALRHVVTALDLRAFGGSALTQDIPVPKDGLTSGIPVTYVPARNAIFLTLALAFAESAQARDLFIGVNAIDYSGYPDCRPDFIASFEEMARLATRVGDQGERFCVRAPLLHMSKGDIMRKAAEIGFDLGQTWSCYDPTPDGLHCGLCDSCRLRHQGFLDAGLPDPTRYAVQPPLT